MTRSISLEHVCYEYEAGQSSLLKVTGFVCTNTSEPPNQSDVVYFPVRVQLNISQFSHGVIVHNKESEISSPGSKPLRVLLRWMERRNFFDLSIKQAGKTIRHHLILSYFSHSLIVRAFKKVFFFLPAGLYCC